MTKTEGRECRLPIPFRFQSPDLIHHSSFVIRHFSAHEPATADRPARILWAALTGLAIATLVALVVALLWGTGRVLHVLSPVIWPLAVAAVIAYLLDPIIDFLQRTGAPRARAIA